jgi:hypothetical protein
MGEAALHPGYGGGQAKADERDADHLRELLASGRIPPNRVPRVVGAGPAAVAVTPGRRFRLAKTLPPPRRYNHDVRPAKLAA